MKRLLFFFMFIIYVFQGVAQVEPISAIGTPSNSFKSYYDKENPHLKYSYHESTQIHNYSGNWDFDGDGKLDSLFFIGNGGAHLKYYLKIIISSNKQVENFEFLATDFPLLQPYDSLKKDSNKHMYFPKFVVHDFNGDLNKDIYLNIGTYSQSTLPAELKKANVTSNKVILYFENKKFHVDDFSFGDTSDNKKRIKKIKTENVVDGTKNKR